MGEHFEVALRRRSVEQEEPEYIAWLLGHDATIADALAAAREMLRFGDHDGACSFLPNGQCSLHLEAAHRREQALEDALAALDEASGG